MQLEGRTVVVTGAGGGMGRGIAEAVAEAGAHVVAGDLALEPVAETARRIEIGGGRAVPLVLDVTDPESIAAAITRATRTFGRLDGWVNNAGILRMDAALDVPAADWEAQMRVNVSGLFSCCQIVARQLIAQGEGGAIVNVASNAGKVGYPNPHRINVNAVCPGGVETPMLMAVAEWITSRHGGDPKELVQRMVPAQLGRHIQPIEVGRVVAFLLSDAAAIIRGQSVNVDGGDTPY